MLEIMKELFYTYDNVEGYYAGNTEYSACGIDTVDIDWIFGEASIVETVGDRIRVYEDTNADSDKFRVHSVVRGKKLYIKFIESGIHTGISGMKLRKNLTVEIPSGFNVFVNTVSATVECDRLHCRDLRIETVSGTINLGEIKAACQAELTSVSGTISAKELLSYKLLTVNSTSGYIDIVGASVEKTELSNSKSEFKTKTVSGKIVLGSVRAECAFAETVSGSIDLRLKECYDVHLKSVSGSIVVKLPRFENVTAHFDTVSGVLKTPDGIFRGKKTFFEGNGRVKVDMHSISGSLSILKAEE